MESETGLQGALGSVRIALRAAKSGDYSQHADVDLPDDHPVSVLAEGVNEMVSALGKARDRNKARLLDIEREVERIEAQRLAIQALSTPIIELWNGIICVPIVGLVDTQRASDVTQSLLDEVVSRRVRAVIIDITGVQVMDTSTTSHFLRLAAAVKLLGASCAISGFSPSIVATIVHMGMTFSELRTFRTMRDALQHYLVER
jgi:rsbT co-antagonist protein RsbR